jgi:predicted HTH transcriptional regulator
MNATELKKLLKDLCALPAETEAVEFKVNNSDKDELGKRISAISNTANLLDKKAGYIVFGVTDDPHDI